jgi:hypothetical protein
MARLTTHDRFLAKIDKRPNGCWQWVGALGPDGYGWFHARDKVPYNTSKAYRYAYIHYKGPIPRHLEIDHLCKNRPCVNPDHLEAVSSRINHLRSNGVGARNLRKTTCHRGHSLTDQKNLRIERAVFKHSGNISLRRRCLPCERIYRAARRAAAKLKVQSQKL